MCRSRFLLIIFEFKNHFQIYYFFSAEAATEAMVYALLLAVVFYFQINNLNIYKLINFRLMVLIGPDSKLHGALKLSNPNLLKLNNVLNNDRTKCSTIIGKSKVKQISSNQKFITW